MHEKSPPIQAYVRTSWCTHLCTKTNHITGDFYKLYENGTVANGTWALCENDSTDSCTKFGDSTAKLDPGLLLVFKDIFRVRAPLWL